MEQTPINEEEAGLTSGHLTLGEHDPVFQLWELTKSQIIEGELEYNSFAEIISEKGFLVLMR